ncbi:sulfotransferase domain-containing protein [Thalassotalea litorea]|uniref:Sulfotransferase domain-containing protein n=1 Tax=Thalassotalea litorea TaxID=2020715 RepID=A0A5R9IZG3_9GAMM|nr:sulfotransferase [Thalassotalea litorea]TLU67308.1 sulfotransferase domain-containing protein [Thalassotalea litorea]
MVNSNSKVNFIIAGTQKGGTTALDFYLRQHPGIAMASKKEVHFFDRDDRYQRWRNIAYYHKHFNFSNKEKIVGEATPSYMYSSDAIERIYQYNPEIKLIAVLRNPIDRAFSHWNMTRLNKFEPLSFSQAITKEQVRCRRHLPGICQRYSYIDRGFYTEQIRRMRRYFDDTQLLFIRHESLKQNPAETLHRVTEFLQVSPFPAIQPKDIHSKPYDTKMSEVERARLNELYYYEIKQLERMLNWDCSAWLTTTPQQKTV